MQNETKELIRLAGEGLRFPLSFPLLDLPFSLFPIFLSGVGVGVSGFGFGVFPFPFFLRQSEYDLSQTRFFSARLGSREYWEDLKI